MVQNGLSKKSITTTEAYGESRVEPDKKPAVEAWLLKSESQLEQSLQKSLEFGNGSVFLLMIVFW